MIWESQFWKDDLLRKAQSFDKRRTQRRWPEASLAKIEQDVMLAAYSMRKLVEAEQLSDDVKHSSMKVRTFAATGKAVTRLNWHRLEELYELDAPAAGSISLRDLCNQFVHSYVFVPELGDGGLQGFLVASDRERSARLFGVALVDFIQVLRRVGTGYPTEIRMSWKEKKQDYRVRSKATS